MIIDFPIEAFARSWFEEWSEEPPFRGWATMLLEQMIDHQPDSAWSLILQLVATAEADDELGWVAAGPLENLLADHGPQFIERVEQCASSNARFRECLREVWGHSRFEPSVYQRVQRIVGHSEAKR